MGGLDLNSITATVRRNNTNDTTESVVIINATETPTAVINTKLPDDKKLEILVDHGYTPEEAKKFIKEHPELTTREALIGFILKNKPLEEKKDDKTERKKSDLNQNLSFSDFSKADLKTKVLILAEEYTKNQNLDNWDNLSPEEKVQKRELAIKDFIDKNNKTGITINYEKLQDYIIHPEKLSELSDTERQMYENLMKSYMLDLQIANKKGKTIEDYYKQDEKLLTPDKYKFLRDLQQTDKESFENISFSDKEFFENETIIMDAFKSRFKNIESLENIDDAIKKYNDSEPDKTKHINKAVVVYEYLKAKNPEELSREEKRLFDHYKKFVESGRPPLNKVSDFDSTNKTFREMAQNEIYQKAFLEAKKNKVEDPAYQAVKVYVETRLRNASNINERRAIIKELIKGTSLSGREVLNKVLENILAEDNSILKNAKGIQEVSTIVDEHDVVLKGSDISPDDLKLAYEDKTFDSEMQKDIGTFVGVSYAKAGEGKKDDLIKVSQFSEMDDKLVAASMDEADWSEQSKYDVADDVNKNWDSYTQEARNSRIKQAGHYISENRSSEFQTNLKNSIIQHQDESAYEAFGGSASSYKGKGQRTLADNVMSMANYFSDEANIKAQSALANDVQNCDVENQLEIHSTIMNKSKYDEVLELASSNIHNYDESVQADAIRVTYATGNENVIRACEGQLDQCKGVNASESTYANYVQNQSTAQAINDAIKIGDTQKLIELVENNNIEITNYLNSRSQKEKEIFVEKYCKAANESQLLTFLKSNTSMLDLVMRYANGKISKEKVFGAVYNGNKGEIRDLLNTLGIKGEADIVKLARTYKEIAPDIALETENSALARSIITNPNEWGYQLGRQETKKLQELASKKQILQNTDTTPEIATTLRSTDGLEFYPKDREGFLRA